MHSFDEIFAMAAARHGGAEAVEMKLSRPAPRAALLAQGDDRWLSAMTKAIFQAGFNWSVIEAKWPGFEEAFAGFDPAACANLDAEAIEGLMSDARVVRNGAKLASVPANALMLLDLAQEHGKPAGAVFADWPDAELPALLELLKKRGARLGGVTGARVLRAMGRDAWILSDSVVARLKAEGVIEGPTGSRKAMAAVQGAFDAWMAQSGRSMTEISRVLALSIDP